AAQAGMLSRICGSLNDTETEIVRRGRNAHPKHTGPRNQQPENYAASTGFEALLGYLYLTGQNDRIRALYQIIKEQESQNG
ncbi:MAG: ribonuclease III domain-containing protein, partial [Clostridia bacterium]